MNLTRSSFLIVPLFLLILIIGCSSNQKRIYSGTVEGEEIPVVAEINGSITNLYVEEGDIVEKKQFLAQIDDKILKAQLKEMKAMVKGAKAVLDEARTGTRSQEIEKTLARLDQNRVQMESIQIELSKLEDLLLQKQEKIKQTEIKLASAKSTKNYQKDEFNKMKTLYNNGIISESKYHYHKDQLNQASSYVDMLKNQLITVKSEYEMLTKNKQLYLNQRKELIAQEKKIKATLDLQYEGSTNFSITKLVSQWEQAKAKEEQLKIQYEKTNIYSPVDGVIIRKNVAVGEVVKPNSQLYTVLNQATRKISVFVPEAVLPKIELGGHAEIMIDAYPNKIYKGVITYIASEAEFTPKNVQTPEERTKIVFEVVVEPVTFQKELKPGIPADIKFISGEQ